jgi:murein peptide amidase A
VPTSSPLSVATTAASTTSSPPATTSTSTTTSTTTLAPTTTTTSTTGAPTTTLPGIAGLATDALQVLEIGRSVNGRPITAVERGTPGGTVVLVIGVIHGDEAAGVKIVEELATAALPPGIDLWLVESMNPDGQAAATRTNANLVDLNRNFPYNWAPLGEPGDSQYGGAGPASEPETQAIVEFVSAIHPDIGVWYHQDLFRIAPGQPGRDAEVRARYAELTGLPVLDISGGTYTGVAATWQRTTISDGVAFIVELGPTLSRAEAAVHAAAVIEISR